MSARQSPWIGNRTRPVPLVETGKRDHSAKPGRQLTIFFNELIKNDTDLSYSLNAGNFVVAHRGLRHKTMRIDGSDSRHDEAVERNVH